MSDISSQLVDQVKACIDNNQKIIVEGAGTKKSLGRSTYNDSARVIATKEHTGIINYEPVELVMTVRSGTTLKEIDEALAENNQVLACDPPRFNGEATFGGSLAANLSGPSRPWLGSIRDHVLGVNLINGRGEHLRFGGKVMKNVAGYDVSRLQAGAMGTLGLMTEMSFKVLPKLAVTSTLRAEATQADAIRIMNELSGQPKPLMGACWLDNHLYLRLSGAKSAVEGTLEQWLKKLTNPKELSVIEALTFWSNLREQSNSFFSQRNANDSLWRFSLNSAAPAHLEGEHWLIDWAGSQRFLKGDFSQEDLSTWVREQGGEVVLYQGGDRTQEIITEPNSVMKTLQKNIKHSFDPQNIFNAGRLYGWM
jgi:glycolate oxidase FAD binding subunit